VKGLANMAALFAIALIVGALAGSVAVSAPAVVPGGVTLQGSGGGSSSGSHGSHGACVSSYVHMLQDRFGSAVGLGQWVRNMVRRC